MSKEDEFAIIAEEEVDDDLTLLLARSGGMPRLGIFNTNSGKKKYVQLAWIEGAERTLKIKVGKSTKEYQMATVVEGVAELIKKAGDELNLNSLTLLCFQILNSIIHMPKLARSDADLRMIQDDKKETLWYVYAPRKGDWRAKPCFIPAPEEKPILDKYVTGDYPWPAVTFENGDVPHTLVGTHCVKELTRKLPARWMDLLMPISKGMLLGFSDFSTDSDATLGKELWKILKGPNARSEDSMKAIIKAGGPLLRHIIAYLRLWPVLGEAKTERVGDATKTAEEREWKKRERFELTTTGDRRYKVTRLSEEGNIEAFALVPETRLPGEDDRIFSLREWHWDDCVDACSIGGEKDPQYTCSSIIYAIEMRDWLARVSACLSGHVPGAGGEGAQ